MVAVGDQVRAPYLLDINLPAEPGELLKFEFLALDGLLGKAIQAEVGQVRSYGFGNTVGFLGIDGFFRNEEALRLRL